MLIRSVTRKSSHTSRTTSPNDATLKIYARTVDEYIANTPSVYDERHKPLIRWIDSFIEHIPEGGKVLEIGSATNRDATYMRSKGVNVICSDAVEEFVDNLKASGEDAITFNPLKDEIDGQYDAFFANAVLPHFTPEDLELCLTKIYNVLGDKGSFAFGLKQGKGKIWILEKISKERYICYWQPKDLYKLIKSIGFGIAYWETDVQGSLPSHIWTNVVVTKKNCDNS